MKILLLIHLSMIFVCAVMSQDHYTAAVVEYAPSRELYYLPYEIVLKNANRYVDVVGNISSIKKVSIIIFPEYGLTTLEVLKKLPEHLESYSIEIPSLQEGPRNPCSSPGGYHKVLIDISCVAFRTYTYVVVHFLEKERIGENKYIFYNTNLVFDNNGTISHKYRKKNLHIEENIRSGGKEQMNYFTTNFGVKFGLLMGADILYQNSFSSGHSKNLNNIIYSTAWPSEAPFLHGLSIQQGFAKSNKMNLLTACLNDPTNNSSGSGIFFANGSISKYYMSGVKNTTYLIADIPKHPEYVKQTNSQFNEDSKEQVHHNIHLKIEDESNYTLESIDLTKGFVRSCSKINEFCCYSIHSTQHPNQQKYQNQDSTEYDYKLVSFHGVRNLNYRTIGVSICAVVFCSTSNSSSCGLKGNYLPTITFKYINITIQDKTSSLNIDYRPITLEHSLKPITDYSIHNDAVIRYRIWSRNISNSVWTYGIFGRIYDYDDQSPGPVSRVTDIRMISAENSTRNKKGFFTIIIISCVVSQLIKF